MPYDILQLNDMLVPELVDVAEKLKIVNARSLDKQALIYKILDQQALKTDGQSTTSDDSADGKKRRLRKPRGENSQEKAAEEEKPAAKIPEAEDKKRKGRKNEESSNWPAQVAEEA